MEKLKQWLGAQHGRGAALAQRLKVRPPVVFGWISGKRPVPVSHAAAIESFTAGSVTRQDLFPDDWQRIWPELAAAEPTTEHTAT